MRSRARLSSPPGLVSKAAPATPPLYQQNNPGEMHMEDQRPQYQAQHVLETTDIRAKLEVKEEIKEAGLGFMKSVQAHRKRTKSELCLCAA